MRLKSVCCLESDMTGLPENTVYCIFWQPVEVFSCSGLNYLSVLTVCTILSM